MFTPHTARLADGNEIFYTDSGIVPESSDYTTLIVIHGSAFNGHGFEKLHPLSAKYNFRTIIINRKDYPGSTRYTDAELDDLNNGRAVFLDRLAVLMANFLKYLIDELKIPKISVDRKNGGFALVAWSMGTATGMPLFSNPDLISKDLYNLLQEYVKDLILYDPPYLSFGYDLPPDHKTYNPWTDPECKTPEDLYSNFKTWVGGYYVTADDWSGNINELDFRKRTERSTVGTWTAEESKRNFNHDAAVRSELHMYHPPMQPTVKKMSGHVMYDEKLAQSFFPAVGISYIHSGSSNWHCIWAAHEARRLYKEHVARGEKIRPTKFLTVKTGNHFMHYDDPDGLLSAIAQCIRGN